MIGTTFALQNAWLASVLSNQAAVYISQSVRKVGVLIHIGVIRDGVPCPLGVKMGGNRLKQVSHLQLQGVGLWLRFHTALFHHPKLQRSSPGRQAENSGHIAAAHSVLDVTLRAMFSALQPALFIHAGTVA